MTDDQTDAELVSCDNCGVVCDLEVAHDLVRCPVCEIKAEVVSIPRYGNVHKWWSKL